MKNLRQLYDNFKEFRYEFRMNGKLESSGKNGLERRKVNIKLFFLGLTLATQKRSQIKENRKENAKVGMPFFPAIKVFECQKVHGIPCTQAKGIA